MLGDNQADGRRMVRAKAELRKRWANLDGWQIKHCLGRGGMKVRRVAGDWGCMRDAFDDNICAAVGMTATASARHVMVIGRQRDVAIADTDLDLPNGGSEAAGEEQKSDKTGCEAMHDDEIRPGPTLCKHAYQPPNHHGQQGLATQ